MFCVFLGSSKLSFVSLQINFVRTVFTKCKYSGQSLFQENANKWDHKGENKNENRNFKPCDALKEEFGTNKYGSLVLLASLIQEQWLRQCSVIFRPNHTIQHYILR